MSTLSIDGLAFLSLPWVGIILSVLCALVLEKLSPLRKVSHKNPSNLVLASIGKTFRCQFCGPAIYSGKKVRTEKCGAVFPLKLDHLLLIRPQQNVYLFTFIMCCLAFSFVIG